MVALVTVGSFVVAELLGLRVTLGPAVGNGLLVGVVVTGLLVLARGVVGFSRPGLVVVIAVGMLATPLASVAGASVGHASWVASERPLEPECDGDVAAELVVLAEATGRIAAGGEPRPNWGVVLQNGSPTWALDTGECIALVNATPDDVVAAAASIGWGLEGANSTISPSGMPIVFSLDEDDGPREPDMHPVVQLGTPAAVAVPPRWAGWQLLNVVTPPDPAVVLAREFCGQVRAATGADEIFELGWQVWQEVMERGLDEERVDAAAWDDCGELLAAAGDELDATHAEQQARSDELADAIVVTVEDCGEAGAQGTVTNGSQMRVTVAEIWVSFYTASGLQLPGGIVEVADYGQVPELAAGASATWSVGPGEGGEPEENEEFDLDPEDPIVRCETSVELGGWR
jgi:hypothetical protein